MGDTQCILHSIVLILIDCHTLIDPLGIQPRGQDKRQDVPEETNGNTRQKQTRERGNIRKHGANDDFPIPDKMEQRFKIHPHDRGSIMMLGKCRP